MNAVVSLAVVGVGPWGALLALLATTTALAIVGVAVEERKINPADAPVSLFRLWLVAVATAVVALFVAVAFIVVFVATIALN